MTLFATIFALVFLIFSYHQVICLGIIGGSPSTHRPFFVKVELNGSSSFCGGTLVAPNKVVTSARCLAYRDTPRWAYPSEIQVTKNNNLFKLNLVNRFSVEKYVFHHAYDPVSNNGRNPFDIAIIQLGECLDMTDGRNQILSLCPDTTEFKEGLALGLGLISTDPDVAAGMKLTFFPLFEKKKMAALVISLFSADDETPYDETRIKF